MHQNQFSAPGPRPELMTLPRPPSRMGRGTPLPIPSPSIDLAAIPLLLKEIYANAYEGRLPLTSWWRKSSNMTWRLISVKKITLVKHDSRPIQSHILNPPFLRLTPRKPLWLDLQS